MSSSKLNDRGSGHSSRDIVELNNVIPLNETSENYSIDLNRVEKLDNNVQYDRSSLNKGKEIDNEELESSETADLIYSYTTLRLPKKSIEEMEEQIETIASHIERKGKLMQDDPVSEAMRLDLIRNMPQGLTLKRSVKAKLTLSVSQKSKKRPISFWKKLYYRWSMSLTKTKLAFHQIGFQLELWYHPMKRIEGHFGSGIATYFKFLRYLFIINTLSCIVSILFITVPQALIQSHKNGTFSSWDLLLGNGFFTNSILYYGFYANRTLIVDSNMTYDIPSAYFSTFAFCYIFVFILLFFNWDWGISSYKAANLRSASLYRELEELLWESKNVYVSSTSTKILTFLIRIAMTSLVITIICGTGILLWLLLNEHYHNQQDVLSVLTIPLVMTGIVNFIPPILSWAIKYEKYSKDRIAMYITLIRVYLIAATAVATLYTFWLTRGIESECWPTRLSQEIYRLILLDFFVSIFGSFVVQGLRATPCIKRKFGAPTFDIARNTLNLVYNQSLFWLVHYFSPSMSLIILVKMLLTFYMKKRELLSFCEPPSKFWRAAQTQTLSLAMAFLGMISAVVVHSYVLIYVNTRSCGPFSGWDYIWEFAIERMLNVNRNSQFWHILGEICNPGTGIALLFALCLAVYYLRAKAEASKQMVRILREMLQWQARDKKFLLKTFNTASNKRLPHNRRASRLHEELQTTTNYQECAYPNEPSTSTFS
ncbi:transmembrane channel-like protein 3 isoform X2 [Phymastichus coffea]|uniref:transmembrane channel-like protein 3 isoform X2 n=1 Tax=Phymastichus coffea TaxID=108790 RepID=UPI00273CCAFB|nr:transmembrane channel-like protein 3 isoform X2 [Phymastichus coffea]